MDDDFNVIGAVDEDQLTYPEQDELNEGQTVVNEAAGQNTVLAELNGINRRPGKRRISETVEDDPSFSHPIDWHMRMPLTLEEQSSKRYKKLAEEELLDRITSKIMEARLKRTGGKMVEDTDIEENDEVKGEILKIPPSDGSDWLGVSSDGNDERFYVRLIRQGKALKKLKAKEKRDDAISGLSHIAQEVLEYKMKLHQNQKENEQILEEDMPTVERRNPSDSLLWVDKYSPKGYPDLISDDAINRNILTWLRLWDECVFRRKIDNFEQMVGNVEREQYCLDTGKPRRPLYKILLLSGPAGLGKTTLAKIVARQAGYDIVEVNASDSRTIADFERVLEGSVRSSKTISLTGTAVTKGRPNCLIIDEIDGAPIDSIRYLVRAVQATGKKMLRRPIICICNNLFTRALRELKTVALSIVMNPPKEERLIQRLSQISNKENLKTDHNGMSRLVQLCHCDIRQALNALQYIAAAKKNNNNCVTAKDIQEAVEHESSSHLSIFDAWSAILDFSKHHDNKRNLCNPQTRIRTIQKLVTEEGSERFVTGLHSNYVKLPLPIGTIHKASSVFLFHDEITRIVNHTQNYIVLRYEIAFYALLHLTVATHHKVQLKYPQFEQNIAQRFKESQETLSSMRSNLSRRSERETVEDILPFVVSIVQPPIKPMNEQLYGKKDREIINDVVKIMHEFNLTYRATMVNTQVHFVFQPSIDVLTLYNLLDNKHRIQLPNSVRQMIARHVELYSVRDKITKEEIKVPQNKAMKAVSAASRAQKKLTATELYFHYNPGVSSAVRKNVRMRNIFS